MHHHRASQLAGLILFVALLATALAAAAAPIAQPIIPLTSSSSANYSASSDPQSFVNLGNRTVFFTEEPKLFPLRPVGSLWATQGTPATTESLDSKPLRFLDRVGGLLYYLAQNDLQEVDLWRTDGTRQGTIPLARNVLDFSPKPFASAQLDQVFYFTKLGSELWRSGGAPESTEKVLELDGLLKVLSFQGSLVLLTHDALWASDGTAAGTQILAGGLNLRSYHDAQISGDRLYFFSNVTQSGQTVERLWALESPTSLPVEIVTSAGLVAVLTSDQQGGTLFLDEREEHGMELWKVAQDSLVPARLTDFPESAPFTFWLDPWIWVDGDLTYFLRGSSGSTSLWRVEDGPRSQLQVSTTCAPGSCPTNAFESQRFGDYLAYFNSLSTPAEVFITDGSLAGTQRLRDLCPAAACNGPFLQIRAVEDSLFFINQVARDNRLWRLDGTSLNTELIGSFRRGLTQDGFVEGGASTSFGWIFNLFQGRHGNEPWVFHKDTREAFLLEDISIISGRDANNYLRPESGELVFMARKFLPIPGGRFDSIYRLGPDGNSRLQWAISPVDSPQVFSDGERTFVTLRGPSGLVDLYLLGPIQHERTLLGTFKAPNSFARWEGRTYFLSPEGTSAGVWVTDGTPSGTQRIFGSSSFEYLWYYGLYPTPQGLIFATVGGANDNTLWISDGTAGGTLQLDSLGNSPSYSDVHLGTPLETDQGTYFSTCFSTFQSLEKIDFDAATVTTVGIAGACNSGTRLVPTQHGIVLTSIREPDYAQTEVATVFSFRDRSSGGNGLNELVSAPFEASSIPVAGLDGGIALFPFVSEELGMELWRTDGSAAGTEVVKDLRPGLASSSPTSLTPFGDQLYFTADDGAHGRELWVSDGTEEGTRLVHDIFPGAQSSNPRELTLVEDRLYFTAESGIRLPELWVLPLDGSAPPCRASEETLCLQGQRFQVEADWRDFQNRRGEGKAVSLSEDTGYFWFFDDENVELVAKVLDGQAINDHYWTFFGALSNVEYWLTVTDTDSGLTRRYYNRPRNFASVGDTQSFGPKGASLEYSPAPTATPSFQSLVEGSYLSETSPLTECVPSSQRLCLNGGRFAVEAQWTDFQGNSGAGIAREVTDDTGTFWFFQPSNTELILKVLDGRTLNNRFWVFYGSLSNVDFDITVTDTQSGRVKRYQNRNRQFASVGDTRAF